MGWDPAVLRKYNTTGHFRLLNQLRSELQANPMPLLARATPAENPSIGRSRRAGRTVEVRPLAYGRGRRGASTIAASASAAAVPASTGEQAVSTPALLPSSGASQAQALDAANSSFRDRLSAIEMR
ncbi:MAG: hypothetical protein VKO44_05740 [Cyanobacteriota bacterium]|nr:hypothetical protein [Cyanobacteriota bacterium]